MEGPAGHLDSVESHRLLGAGIHRLGTPQNWRSRGYCPACQAGVSDPAHMGHELSSDTLAVGDISAAGSDNASPRRRRNRFARALAGGGFAEVSQAGGLRWYYLTGGPLGAIYVTTVLLSVRELGAGGVTAATVSGQLTMSVLLDRAGLLGLPERGLTAQRVLGIALLAAGTVLVVRE